MVFSMVSLSVLVLIVRFLSMVLRSFLRSFLWVFILRLFSLGSMVIRFFVFFVILFSLMNLMLISLSIERFGLV